MCTLTYSIHNYVLTYFVDNMYNPIFNALQIYYIVGESFHISLIYVSLHFLNVNRVIPVLRLWPDPQLSIVCSLFPFLFCLRNSLYKLLAFKNC